MIQSIAQRPPYVLTYTRGQTEQARFGARAAGGVANAHPQVSPKDLQGQRGRTAAGRGQQFSRSPSGLRSPVNKPLSPRGLCSCLTGAPTWERVCPAARRARAPPACAPPQPRPPPRGAHPSFPSCSSRLVQRFAPAVPSMVMILCGIIRGPQAELGEGTHTG